MANQTIGDMTVAQLMAELGDAGDEEQGSPLGFVDNPGANGDTQFVFLNRTEFNTGHMMNENEEPIPLPGEAMAGYMEDVYYDFRESDQFGLSQKLRVVLNIEDGRIMMESGFFTNTGKSILANLAEVQDPGALLAIEPSLPDNPGESPNVLFTELYEDGELIQDSTWPHEDQQVIELFHEVREGVFGFEPQDVEPQLPDRSSGGGRSNGRSSNGRNSSGRSGGGRSGGGNGRSSSQGNGARQSNRRQSSRRKKSPPTEV